MAGHHVVPIKRLTGINLSDNTATTWAQVEDPAGEALGAGSRPGSNHHLQTINTSSMTLRSSLHPSKPVSSSIK